MEQLKISVVVPIYNVDAFLDCCIQSIVAQSYKNLEIILVDDGSPDNCPAMCDAWAERDSRIKVIHKKNGGLSDARNAGMAVASGTYLSFVDSDDWIAPEMYQSLVFLLEKDHSDIAACGVEMVWDGEEKRAMLTPTGDCILEKEEAMRSIIQETRLKQPVWYKLYRRTVVENILFPVGKYHEDVFWSYQVIGNARRVSVIDRPLYFYRQRTGSIMGKGFSLRRLDALEAYEARLKYVKEFFPQLMEETVLTTWFSCMYQQQMALRHLEPPQREYATQKIKKTCMYLKSVDLRMRRLPFKQKIWFNLSKINFLWTCKLRNQLRVGQ